MSPRILWLLVVPALVFPALVAAVDVGQTAPAFELPRVSGEGRVSLASLRGKVVVIDFWASWCQPCIRAFPELDQIQQRYGSRGVQVLAVSIDDEVASARRALGSESHQFTALHDPGMSMAGRYGIGGALPATVIVDREGTVRFVRTGGAVEPAELRRVIESLL